MAESFFPRKGDSQTCWSLPLEIPEGPITSRSSFCSFNLKTRFQSKVFWFPADVPSMKSGRLISHVPVAQKRLAHTSCSINICWIKNKGQKKSQKTSREGCQHVWMDWPTLGKSCASFFFCCFCFCFVLFCFLVHLWTWVQNSPSLIFLCLSNITSCENPGPMFSSQKPSQVNPVHRRGFLSWISNNCYYYHSVTMFCQVATSEIT